MYIKTILEMMNGEKYDHKIIYDLKEQYDFKSPNWPRLSCDQNPIEHV